MGGGSPDPVMTTARVSALLLGSGSGVGEEAVAVFVSEPAIAVTRTEIVTVARAPTFSVPRAAVTVPLVPTGGPEQTPGLEEQDRKTVPAGSGSVSRTLAAACGPAFETSTV